MGAESEEAPSPVKELRHLLMGNREAEMRGKEYRGERYHMLSTGVRGNARSPARKQHLGLPGGAAGAMDIRLPRA